MCKIAFYELLGMIRNGTQPQKVRINNTNFWWDEIYNSYTSGDGLYLTFWMHYSMSDEKLANNECIEIEGEQEELKEEPKEKSDAEAFIDNLLETLVLRSKSLEFTDMWAISNTMLGYVDGKKAMIEDVIKIIKEYKEKK